MTTETKLKLLEVVGGLFGWGWILASLVGVYFLFVAITFGGSWVNCLIAFGTSATCKWLAGGFIDNQKRVAFETQMIRRGMTPEQAADAWLRAYVGSNKTDR